MPEQLLHCAHAYEVLTSSTTVDIPHGWGQWIRWKCSTELHDVSLRDKNILHVLLSFCIGYIIYICYMYKYTRLNRYFCNCKGLLKWNINIFPKLYSQRLKHFCSYSRSWFCNSVQMSNNLCLCLTFIMRPVVFLSDMPLSLEFDFGKHSLDLFSPERFCCWNLALHGFTRTWLETLQFALCYRLDWSHDSIFFFLFDIQIITRLIVFMCCSILLILYAYCTVCWYDFTRENVEICTSG